LAAAAQRGRPDPQTTRTFSAGKPAMKPSITSPATTGPTFSGVPLKMMSPGFSSKACDSLLICSAHAPDHLIQVGVLLDAPLTFSEIAPAVK
jgi:hypothetical protein